MGPLSVAFLFGFFSFDVLAAWFCQYWFYGVQQEGEVLHIYKGLIQLAVTGANSS
jgi:hypothetical protein